MDEKYPGKVAFVRADHYFNLYNEAHGLPFNLAMSPMTSIRSSDETESAERAADGTPATTWTSSKAGTKWLEFDFGDACQITRYVIRHAAAGGAGRDLNTRDFTLQASSDGKSWKPIDVVNGNSDNVTDVEVDPFTARYVKVVIDHPGEDSTARIADIEIFGSNKKVPP
jgi:hypothetical protein